MCWLIVECHSCRVLECSNEDQAFLSLLECTANLYNAVLGKECADSWISGFIPGRNSQVTEFLPGINLFIP